ARAGLSGRLLRAAGASGVRPGDAAGGQLRPQARRAAGHRRRARLPGGRGAGCEALGPSARSRLAGGQGAGGGHQPGAAGARLREPAGRTRRREPDHGLVPPPGRGRIRPGALRRADRALRERPMTPLCRFCRAPLTETFLNLGDQPLANSYLTAEQLEAGTERAFPLHARVCGRCWVQVDDPVPADEIVDEGSAYFSSYSAGWVEPARRYAEAMRARFGLGTDSLVVEVASNDGYLLQHFVAMGVPVLGIEPTLGTAEAARAKGVPTEVMFFGAETGQALADRGARADLMAANNVLAHVP